MTPSAQRRCLADYLLNAYKSSNLKKRFSQESRLIFAANALYSCPMSDDESPDTDKVVSFKRPPSPEQSEPLINLPPATKWLLAGLIGVHLVVHLLLPGAAYNWIFGHMGFIPARWMGALDFEIFTLLTPVSYMLLHASWLHLIMNAVMLMAFGSGIERWMGARRMIIFSVLCGVIAVAAHFALNTGSMQPVVGASGALSGLFAAALIMINRGHSELGGRFGLLPFIVIWIGISIAFGMTGAPDGSAIAWAAHIGGFLGGFAVLKLMKI